MLLKHLSVVNSFKKASQTVGKTLATLTLKARPAGATGYEMGFVYLSFTLLKKTSAHDKTVHRCVSERCCKPVSSVN